MAVIGWLKPNNFKHIIINNGCHESVGGQPNAGLIMNIPSIAKSVGYNVALSAKTREEIIKKMEILKSSKGPAMLEIKVNPGSRRELGRPTEKPLENKKEFMRFLSS